MWLRELSATETIAPSLTFHLRARCRPQGGKCSSFFIGRYGEDAEFRLLLASVGYSYVKRSCFAHQERCTRTELVSIRASHASSSHARPQKPAFSVQLPRTN